MEEVGDPDDAARTTGKKLAREAVESPSLEVAESTLDAFLAAALDKTQVIRLNVGVTE